MLERKSRSQRLCWTRSLTDQSPEEIHFQHPILSLAQIHGALTYYYENQDEVDEHIRRGLEESDKLAVRLSDAEFRRKLLELKRPL